MKAAFSHLKLPKLLLLLVAMVILLSILASSYAVSRTVRETSTQEALAIGDKDHPTTDTDALKQALSKVSGVRSVPKPAWVHFRYQGYQTPPEIPHPMHSKDGFRTVDTWYFINKAGFIEKNEIIVTDMQGNVLQHSACAEDICGNLSKLALPEFDGEPVSNAYQPVPYNPNPASSWIQEVDSSDATGKGWLEHREGETIFFISFERAPSSGKVSSNIPENQGSIIRRGISMDRGIMVHYSVHKIINGKEIAEMIDNLVLFETMGSNPEKDAEIADIIAALKKREAK